VAEEDVRGRTRDVDKDPVIAVMIIVRNFEIFSAEIDADGLHSYMLKLKRSEMI
jgi:hypothetical protein